MNPKAAALALRGWQPYLSERGRYCLLGAPSGRGLHYMVMLWPEIINQNTVPFIQRVPTGEVNKSWSAISWEEVPEYALDKFMEANT